MVPHRERPSREKRSTLVNVIITMCEAAGNLVGVKFIVETLAHPLQKMRNSNLDLLMLVKCSNHGATGRMFQPTPITGAVMIHTLTNIQFAGLAARSTYFGIHHTCRKSLQKYPAWRPKSDSYVYIYIVSPRAPPMLASFPGPRTRAWERGYPNARAPVAQQKEYLIGIDWLNL